MLLEELEDMTLSICSLTPLSSTSVNKFVPEHPHLSLLENQCNSMKDLRKIYPQLEDKNNIQLKINMNFSSVPKVRPQDNLDTYIQQKSIKCFRYPKGDQYSNYITNKKTSILELKYVCRQSVHNVHSLLTTPHCC